jgi:hypothetical protein
MAATGTAGEAPAVQSAVGMRKQPPSGADGCDAMRDAGNSEHLASQRNSLRIADVCEAVRDDAAEIAIGPARIRTENQGIMSPLL